MMLIKFLIVRVIIFFEVVENFWLFFVELILTIVLLLLLLVQLQYIVMLFSVLLEWNEFFSHIVLLVYCSWYYSI